MDLFDPVGELPGIGHRCRQGHQLHRRRAMNDRLLPDRAALGVVHVMTLIQHHGFHVRQGVVVLIRLGVEHVAEDLCGHHNDGSLTIDAEVSGHQTDVVLAVGLPEIPQFLVGQRLEWRCVEHLLAMGEGPMDGVLPHQGLTGSRGGTHHNRMPLVQRIDGLQLEVIQREGKNRRWVEAGRSHHGP